jgi:hypothetical protein
MANLFDPPPVYTLPLSLGGDLSVDFQNNPSGDNQTFVDYGVGVTVTLVIDTDPALEVDADVTDYHAVVKVESEVTDLIDTDTKWRLIVASPTTPTTETVAARGKVKRFD